MTAENDTADFGGTYFVCGTCRDLFSPEPAWHCLTPGCDHHWPAYQDYCKNCYEPRRGAPLAEPEHFTHEQFEARCEEMRPRHAYIWKRWNRGRPYPVP
jgi:hypothetical protein